FSAISRSRKQSMSPAAVWPRSVLRHSKSRADGTSRSSRHRQSSTRSLSFSSLCSAPNVTLQSWGRLPAGHSAPVGCPPTVAALGVSEQAERPVGGAEGAVADGLVGVDGHGLAQAIDREPKAAGVGGDDAKQVQGAAVAWGSGQDLVEE